MTKKGEDRAVMGRHGFEAVPAAGRLISVEESALVVIDMQEKLLAVMSEKEEALANNVKLAKFARIVGMPVVVTEQEKLGPTNAELAAELEGTEPIMKLDFSACRVGAFRDAVEGNRRRCLVVTGIESHICVTQTVLHLLPKYDVHVVSDAATSRTRANWKVAMDRMRDAGAVITSTEMLMYELLVKAGTPEFKETLGLVK